MAIHDAEVAAFTSSRHGYKQRAHVVVTKAPARDKSALLKRNVVQNVTCRAAQASVDVRAAQGGEALTLGPTALRLIEEEKRAVRRHRKRLARIVVDQWRYFARKAFLALAFRRRVLDRRKRQCWDAWRAAISKRRVKWTMQARAAGRRRLTLERQVWRRWISHVQTQKRYQEAASRLLWMDARRLYSTAFAALKAHVARSLLKRQATASALCYWRLSTLTRYFARWRAAAKTGQEKIAQRIGALQHWAAWRKARVFKVWRRVIITRREHRRASVRVSDKQAGRRKREVLLQWQRALGEKRADDAKLDRAYAFQYMWVVRRAVQQWALFVELRKARGEEKQRALGRAAEHAEHQLGARGFRGWQLFVDGRRRKREALLAAEAEDLMRVKRLAFRAWRKYQSGRQRKRVSMISAQEFACCQTKSRVILAFKLNVQRKRTREQHSVIAGRHWVRRVKRTSFTKWRAVAAAAKVEREATEEMLEEKKMVIVRAWQRDFFLSRAVYCWQRYIASKKHSRSQHRKATHFYRAKLLYKALAGFTAHVSRRREKRSMAEAADEAFRKGLLRRALLVYWREALLSKRAKREAYRIADSFRERRLRRLSLEVWRVRTAKWAIKSAAVRRAALHHEVSQLKKSLHGWKFWRDARREKQRAEDERVQDLRRRLGVHITGRVLAAWVEQHDQRLVRKLRSARARAHFQEVWVRRGLRGWRAWLVKRRRKRAAWERAEGLRERLLERRALVAWKEFLRGRRRRKEEQARALRLWSRTLQRLAFQAWTSYLTKRRLQAASVTSADRLYQAHLVHKTASHWLAKARRRQQLRLQIALEKQALTSIAELARVAPFARRWRHLARRRREEREGGRHRALLDGWATRNVGMRWRNVARMGPFGGGLGGGGMPRTRAVVSTTVAKAQKWSQGDVIVHKDPTDKAQTPLQPPMAGKAPTPNPPQNRERAAIPLSIPDARSADPPSTDRETSSSSEAGPVLSVVERITASIASGASILDALPPWARAHSRPPPRRPAHLLTAGSPAVMRRLTADKQLPAPADRAQTSDSSGQLSEPVEVGLKIEPQESRPPHSTVVSGDLGFETRTGTQSRVAVRGGGLAPSAGLKGFASSAAGCETLPELPALANSLAKRAESFTPGDGPVSDRVGSVEDDTVPRTPDFVRPEGRDPGQQLQGGFASLHAKAAVSRQLVLNSPGPSSNLVDTFMGGQHLARVETLGEPLQATPLKGADTSSGGLASAEEPVFGPRSHGVVNRGKVPPVSAGAIVPVGRLPLDPRIIAQEVTWMEQVLREFDDLKAQSLECSVKLGALKGVAQQESVDTGAAERASGGASEFGAGQLVCAERLWELEQRHAALELRKKLQLPMVKAVAERIRLMALGN